MTLLLHLQRILDRIDELGERLLATRAREQWRSEHVPLYSVAAPAARGAVQSALRCMRLPPRIRAFTSYVRAVARRARVLLT